MVREYVLHTSYTRELLGNCVYAQLDNLLVIAEHTKYKHFSLECVRGAYPSFLSLVAASLVRHFNLLNLITDDKGVVIRAV